MTLPPWFEKVRPWLLPAVVLVLAAVLAYSWNRASRAEADLGKERERREKLEGKFVEEEVTQREVKARFEELKKRVPELEAQIDDLTSRVGKTTVKEVVRIVTVPGPAGGTPRDCPVTPHPDSGSNLPPAGKCLLVEGDSMRVEVDEATVETKAGNKVLLGAASCWRLTPPPETKLYQGNFESPLSQAAVVAEASKPGWGFALLFAATTDKVGVGPVVLLPPFRVFGGEVDASAGFAAGSRGFVAGTAQIGMRLPR